MNVTVRKNARTLKRWKRPAPRGIANRSEITTDTSAGIVTTEDSTSMSWTHSAPWQPVMFGFLRCFCGKVHQLDNFDKQSNLWIFECDNCGRGLELSLEPRSC